jgi:predicted dehydrogenase
VYAEPGHGDFGRFLPGGGIGMGFDDLKTIEARLFAESVTSGRQLAPSVQDGLSAATVLDAAEQSALANHWIQVPTTAGRDTDGAAGTRSAT